MVDGQLRCYNIWMTAEVSLPVGEEIPCRPRLPFGRRRQQIFIDKERL